MAVVVAVLNVLRRFSFRSVQGTSLASYPMLRRWYQHMQSYSPAQRAAWSNTGKANWF